MNAPSKIKNQKSKILHAILCVLLAATLASAQTDSPVAQSQFTFAYRLLQRNEWRLAAQAFDDFLGRFPEDTRYPDACYYRGLIAHVQGDLRLAAWYVDKAERTSLVPDYRVSLLRGKIAADMDQPEEALAHLGRIDVNRLDVATQANLWLTRASCYQQLHRMGPALDALRNAAELDSPLQAHALLELARVQEAAEQLREALASLRQCLALAPGNVADEAARLAGDLHYRLKEYDEAIAHYEQVLTRHADSPVFAGTVVAMMWAQYQGGKFDAVIATHQRYGEALPTELAVEAMYLAGSAFQERGEDADAIARFAVLLSTAPGSKLEDRVLYKSAVSQYRQGQYPAMDQTLQRLRQAHPRSPFVDDADLLLAKADLARNDVAAAAAKLTAVIQKGVAHQRYADALRQRAWLYESRGQIEQAIADYERYRRELLGTQSGDADEAALRLIDLCSRAGRHDEAVELARELTGLSAAGSRATSPAAQQEALYRLAHALRALGQLEAAHEALATLLREHPLSTYRGEALYFDGLVLMALNRAEEALPLLRQAVEAEGLDAVRQINALRLAGLHLRQQQRDDEAAAVLEQLDKVSQGAGLAADERLFLGRRLHEQGHFVAAAAMLTPLTSRDARIPGVARAEALLLIGYGKREQGSPQEALRFFDQVIALADGYDVQAWLAKANTLLALERFEAAIEEYAGLTNVQVTPIAAEAMLNYARAARGLALQRARAGDAPNAEAARQDAREMLLKLVLLHSRPQLSPLPEQAHLELAEVELTLNLADKAEQTYAELIEKFPGSRYGLFAQAMLDAHAGRPEAARLLLMRLDSEAQDAWLAERVHRQLNALEAQP